MCNGQSSIPCAEGTRGSTRPECPPSSSQTRRSMEYKAYSKNEQIVGNRSVQMGNKDKDREIADLESLLGTAYNTGVNNFDLYFTYFDLCEMHGRAPGWVVNRWRICSHVLSGTSEGPVNFTHVEKLIGGTLDGDDDGDGDGDGVVVVEVGACRRTEVERTWWATGFFGGDGTLEESHRTRFEFRGLKAPARSCDFAFGCDWVATGTYLMGAPPRLQIMHPIYLTTYPGSKMTKALYFELNRDCVLI
ncbi:hypothetical protein CHU98_g9018 [Xylaria longipes]|nr:hypothetical protein CHU98_g9018 [Xylaria longipes]